MSKEQYEVCTFSIESFSVSYSHPLTKRNWIKLKLNNTNYFYNESFTEFDTRIIQFESKYYFRFLKSSNSIWYSYSDGDNISTNNGYYSTNVNRSYGEHNLGVSFKKKLRKIKKVLIALELHLCMKIGFIKQKMMMIYHSAQERVLCIMAGLIMSLIFHFG